MSKDAGNIERDEAEGYTPPAQKSLADILTADAEDESLNRYKQQLLGSAKSSEVIVDASDPRSVLVKSITLIVEGRPDITLPLDKGRENDASFKIKEGTKYKIRFDFYVQREICMGLKYVQKVFRHSIPVDKDTYMIGSYGPKLELQSYTTPIDEAPSGLLHRGIYKVTSRVTDDDGHDWLSCNWTLEITSDW